MIAPVRGISAPSLTWVRPILFEVRFTNSDWYPFHRRGEGGAESEIVDPTMIATQPQFGCWYSWNWGRPLDCGFCPLG